MCGTIICKVRSTYLFLDVCDGLMAKSPVGQVHNETRQLPNSFKIVGIDGPMGIGQRSNKFWTLGNGECQLTLLVWVFGSINMVLPLKLAPWLQGEALIRLDFLEAKSWGKLRVSSELNFTRTQFTTKYAEFLCLCDIKCHILFVTECLPCTWGK